MKQDSQFMDQVGLRMLKKLRSDYSSLFGVTHHNDILQQGLSQSQNLLQIIIL